jgi:subtilisin family serine protease
VSVSAATERDEMPPYGESCSSTLVTAPSSGDETERQITTIDLNGTCTSEHSGSSAAAPLVSGVTGTFLD